MKKIQKALISVSNKNNLKKLTTYQNNSKNVSINKLIQQVK